MGNRRVHFPLQDSSDDDQVPASASSLAAPSVPLPIASSQPDQDMLQTSEANSIMGDSPRLRLSPLEFTERLDSESWQTLLAPNDHDTSSRPQRFGPATTSQMQTHFPNSPK